MVRNYLFCVCFFMRFADTQGLCNSCCRGFQAQGYAVLTFLIFLNPQSIVKYGQDINITVA